MKPQSLELNRDSQCVVGSAGTLSGLSRTCACAVRSLQSVHDDEKPFEMELSWSCPASDNEFRKVPAELAAEAERSAKAALVDSDMCARFLLLHDPAYICPSYSRPLVKGHWKNHRVQQPPEAPGVVACGQMVAMTYTYFHSCVFQM